MSSLDIAPFSCKITDMAKSGESGSAETVKISVRVTPRASTNSVTAYVDGVLHVRLTAPPVEGAANEAVCGFVAGLLNLPKSSVSIAGGAHNRNKVLLVTGLSRDQAEERLSASAKP
jgi:uncharacterized protein (TIGR00251 family)